jgi:hypothetical protein
VLGAGGGENELQLEFAEDNEVEGDGDSQVEHDDDEEDEDDEDEVDKQNAESVDDETEVGGAITEDCCWLVREDELGLCWVCI